MFYRRFSRNLLIRWHRSGIICLQPITIIVVCVRGGGGGDGGRKELFKSHTDCRNLASGQLYLKAAGTVTSCKTSPTDPLNLRPKDENDACYDSLLERVEHNFCQTQTPMFCLKLFEHTEILKYSNLKLVRTTFLDTSNYFEPKEIKICENSTLINLKNKSVLRLSVSVYKLHVSIVNLPRI